LTYSVDKSENSAHPGNILDVVGPAEMHNVTSRQSPVTPTAGIEQAAWSLRYQMTPKESLHLSQAR
jgi:hypothetical protein